MDCDKILQTDGGSIITGLRCFSLPLILDCGQAFRWSEMQKAAGAEWR